MCLWSVPTKLLFFFCLFFSSNFSVTRAGREKGNRENISPRKTRGKRERERERRWQSHLILNLLCPTRKIQRYPSNPPRRPHHSRTLHLHHSIKHIKKYTVLTRVAKYSVCVSSWKCVFHINMCVCVWVAATVKLCRLWTGEVSSRCRHQSLYC